MAQGSHVIVSYGCVEGMLGLKGYLLPWEYPWLNLGTRLGTTAVTMPQDGLVPAPLSLSQECLL